MKLNGRTKAIVKPFSYSTEDLARFIDEISASVEETRQLLLKYPTVYVIYYQENGSYRVYVGETNSIEQRTKTHLLDDPRIAEKQLAQIDLDSVLKSETDFTASQRQSARWRAFRDKNSTIIVIGHSLFNKSMTLDIEDRLMLYLSSATDVDSAERNGIDLNNGRRNIQTDYFTREYVNTTFQQIWRRLRKHDQQLFPLERLIRDSALFKASPFHQLNEQQVGAKLQILDAVAAANTPQEDTRDTPDNQLILVQGGAGTGKTVLLSSIFFDLFQTYGTDEQTGSPTDFNAFLLVNHDEQVIVYQQIAEKLGLGNEKDPRVMKPTKFINDRPEEGEKADIVLIDEAHLLWNQGKQSYRGKNQLKDIMKRARIVVAVFDPMQILAGNQFWSEEDLLDLQSQAGEGNIIHLDKQMRIHSDGPAEAWISAFVNDGKICQIPTNDRYKIEIFDSPHALHDVIRRKSQYDEESEVEKGLSRLIATYDWKFSSGKTRPEDSETWDVVIGSDFRLPWNNQGKYNRRDKHKAWAERDQTVDEVGSIFTIQGFDLNYSGVIIGPSVQYRDGKIVFDSSESANPNVINKRTITVEGKEEKIDVSKQLLKNQLNVLLTRGVRGLGIYAVDDALREALLKAQSNK